jgi:hypothetical protein
LPPGVSVENELRLQMLAEEMARLHVQTPSAEDLHIERAELRQLVEEIQHDCQWLIEQLRMLAADSEKAAEFDNIVTELEDVLWLLRHQEAA